MFRPLPPSLPSTAGTSGTSATAAGTPLPPYVPLPSIPQQDIRRAPAEGSLAWLLTHALPPEMQGELHTWLETDSGPVFDDPGLQQAWAHARTFFGERPPAAPADPRFAPAAAVAEPSPDNTVARRPARPLQTATPAGPVEASAPPNRLPPAPEPIGSRPLTQTEKMMTRMTMIMGSHFLQSMGIVPPTREDDDKTRGRMMRRATATAYIFDLPLGRELARHSPHTPEDARRWLPRNIFDIPAQLVRERVQASCDMILEAFAKAPTRPGEAEGKAMVVASFERYFAECLHRFDRMGATRG